MDNSAGGIKRGLKEIKTVYEWISAVPGNIGLSSMTIAIMKLKRFSTSWEESEGNIVWAKRYSIW